MRTIFFDSDYKCRINNPDGSFREVETDFFDGKCDAFIEGYRFIPEGHKWEREDGEVFEGEMIAPWVDYNELLLLQKDYDHQDAENALSILLGGDST